MAFHSFGLITVTTATTAVRVTVNESVPASRYTVQTVIISALVGNTGAAVYLGNSAMVPSTGVGVYAIIPKGTTQQFSIPQSPEGINAADLYICSDSNSDKAIVSGLEQ